MTNNNTNRLNFEWMGSSPLLVLIITFAAVLFIHKAKAQQAPLFAAVKNNNIKEVKVLLDNGADPNVIDDDSDNVLMNAALYASVDCMKLLLQKGANPNIKNKFGQTPLMYCSHDIDKLKLLLQYGADINAKANSGNTPLLIACVGNGQYDIIKLLLDNGADPLAYNLFGETSLMRAAQFGDTATIRLLIGKGVDVNAGKARALGNALVYANWSCASVLLNNGADPNLRDTFGTSVLSFTVVDHVETLKAVLEKMNDVNVPDYFGMTPLFWAAYNEHDNPQIIQVLLDKGARVNIKAKDGSTALSYALKKGNTATVALLKKAGAE